MRSWPMTCSQAMSIHRQGRAIRGIQCEKSAQIKQWRSLGKLKRRKNTLAVDPAGYFKLVVGKSSGEMEDKKTI